MQTKNISVGEDYAMPRRRYGEPEQLLRFHVRAIVTRKEKGQSYSRVEGWVVEEQPLDDKGMRIYNNDAVRTCSPEDLLGPFQEYKELFDRRQAENAEREAKEKAHEEACAKLVLLLYEKTGVPRPEGTPKFGEWGLPYRNSHARIEIGKDGVLPLIAALEKL